MRHIVSVFSPILVNQQVLATLQPLGQYVPRQADFTGTKPESVPVGILNPDNNTVTVFEGEDCNLPHRWRAVLRGGFDNLADACKIKIGSDNVLGGFIKDQMPLIDMQQTLNTVGQTIVRTDWTRVKHALRSQAKRFYFETFQAADKSDARLKATQKLQTTEGQQALDQTLDQVVDRFMARVTTIREINLTKITRASSDMRLTESTLTDALVRTLRLNVQPLTGPTGYGSGVPTTDQRELATAGGIATNPTHEKGYN